VNQALSQLRQMLAAPCAALDFHTHPVADFGPYAVSGPAEDAQLLVDAARRAGISRVVTFSLHRTCVREPTMSQCREANDYALRMRDAVPDVLLPFCYVTPAFPEEAAAEVERCVAAERMVGVKLWVARRATDAGLDPIVATAAGLGVPVLQHAWRKTVGQLENESYPADVADLARRFPQAQIVMAHLNGVNPRGIEAVRDCPNVSVDTSGGDPESGMVELAVARLGSRRVVFGSDSPIRHPAVSLSKILASSLADAAKQDLLWNNASRLLPSWAHVKAIA
jgi:uncharacterized protein